MKPAAIVYSSNTGFTRRYAHMLGEITGLPVRALDEAKADKSMPVIYMGWLMASNVKNYSKAKQRFDVRAVCAVGLCPTGELLAEARAAAKIPEDVALFTVQGGMDHSKLRGVYKLMINMLVKMLSKQKNRSAGDDAMLKMIVNGGDFVDENNLQAVIDWYNRAPVE